MSFHMPAWTATVASASDVDLTPLTDSMLTIQNGHFLPQNDWNILAATYMHAVAGQARWSTPSFRQITQPRIHNLIRAVQPPTFPQVHDYRRNPLTTRSLEELALVVTNAAATSGVGTALAAINTGNYLPAPSGPVYTLRGTSTTAAVANSWTQIAMTWADSLPRGIYAVVGLVHASANGQASRIIFEQQVDRPGAPSQVSEFLVQNQIFLDSGLGEWGRFNSYRMPNVEVLVNGTDASHVVLMDIIRVG